MNKNLFIKRITIENYKAIDYLDSGKFGQINLITGKNNSGKTTFLEALFLILGPTNPQLWTNVSARRGINSISIDKNPADFLFHNIDTSIPIKFQVKTKSFGNYQLSISMRDLQINEQIENQDQDNNNVIATPVDNLDRSKVIEQTILFENGETRTVTTQISSNGIFFQGDRSSIFPTSVFLSSQIAHLSESDVNRYDKVNKTNRLDDYEEILRIIEPNLKRTAIGLLNPNTPAIHADVGFGLVPISTLGSGIQRLASIFLALIDAKNAVVLIDEIENSFHYSCLDSVWNSILNFSIKNNVQIFATTHSSDCIKSAYKISKNMNSNLLFHRLKASEGKRVLQNLSQPQVDSLMSNEWDLR